MNKLKYFFLISNAILIVTLCQLQSCVNRDNFYSLPTYSEKGGINAVIEISAGTNKKKEYNTKTNTFDIDQINGKDRVIDFLPYVGNYGFIPSTYSDPKHGGDGDALDILVLSESIEMGSVETVEPIAVLKLLDDGETDYKIIAVPKDKNKQIIKVNSFNELTANYSGVKTIIELWFLNYNKNDVTIIKGWGDEIEAMVEIEKNIKNK